jgi:two-component system, LytTR family, response regulator LytT
MKALIIEDEPQAQAELKRLLKKADPEIKILTCLGSIEDSVEWLESNEEPDIIFMDIQLSDGISFEIFDKVEIHTPIIFTTAFDEYAIRAFEQNSIDYLLKPIEPEDLLRALTKYKKLHKTVINQAPIITPQILQELTGQKKYKSRFMIKKGETMRYINTSEIAYFYSSSEITFMVTNDKKKYSVDYTLEDLGKMLDPDIYFRVSRKYIAAISSVEEVQKYFNSRLKLILRPDPQDEILVSRARVSEFLKWLEK